MKKILIIITCLGFLISPIASEKVVKGRPSPVTGRVFSEEETQKLMLDLAELDRLREENPLLKEEVVATKDLVQQYKDWLAKEQEKNVLWANQYESLEREYKFEKRKSFRQKLTYLAAGLLLGYGLNK